MWGGVAAAAAPDDDDAVPAMSPEEMLKMKKMAALQKALVPGMSSWGVKSDPVADVPEPVQMLTAAELEQKKKDKSISMLTGMSSWSNAGVAPGAELAASADGAAAPDAASAVNGAAPTAVVPTSAPEADAEAVAVVAEKPARALTPFEQRRVAAEAKADLLRRATASVDAEAARIAEAAKDVAAARRAAGLVPSWESEAPAWHFDAAALVDEFDCNKSDPQLAQDALLIVAVQAAKSPALGKKLIAAGVAPLIMHGGHRFRKVPELMRRSCWCITAIAKCGQTEAAALFDQKPVGGPEVLINAMTYHQQNFEILRWGCRGICAFVESLGKRITLKSFVRLGARELLLRILKMYPDRLYLQKEGQAASDALSPSSKKHT